MLLKCIILSHTEVWFDSLFAACAKCVQPGNLGFIFFPYFVMDFFTSAVAAVPSISVCFQLVLERLHTTSFENSIPSLSIGTGTQKEHRRLGVFWMAEGRMVLRVADPAI